MGKRKNSTKAERTKLLKELGYTEEDMQRFWDECVEINHGVISSLAKAGLNWTDLCIHQISQLPDLKDSTLKARQEKAEKDAKEKAEKERIVEEKAYYKEHFEEVLYNKITNGEQLTEDELRDLVEEMEVESDYGENRRWSRTVTTIVKLMDKFFRVVWEEGLTENQDSDFMNQPTEVELVEKVTVSTVRKWVKAGTVEENSTVDIDRMIEILEKNGYSVRKE